MTALNGLITETLMGSDNSNVNVSTPDSSAESWEMKRALELARVLQTTLDVETLVELFSAELQKSIPHDSVVYRNSDHDLEVMVGECQRHSCSYRLLVSGHSLGAVEFTRSRKFAEREAVLLEYMLSSLLYPLRNALLYHNAVAKSLQDPLTGVKNRASLEAALRREVDLSRRHETPLSLMVLDIDRFKTINDQYGHLIGDSVLRDVAECAEGCMRSTDMLFRYGGEEFVILLNNTEHRGAKLLGERIRKTIERLCCSYGESAIQVTVSIGIASLRDEDNDKTFFARADTALLEAKHNGRNRVIASK